MLVCSAVVSSRIAIAEETSVTTLKAFSVLPGEWIAYAGTPVDQKDLDPFVGRYLLAGTWPEGVAGPDDPRVLLGKGRLAATRIVAIKAESGGRRIRLTADPVVSPEAYRLTLGKIALEASFRGLAANIGPNAALDDVHDAVLPGLSDRAGLAEAARLDPYVQKIAQAWTDPNTPVQLRGWLRFAEGDHKLQFISGRCFTVMIAGEETDSAQVGDRFEATVKFESAGIEQEFKWRFPADKGPIKSETEFLSCLVLSGDKAVPLPAESLLTPWAPESPQETPSAFAEPPYALTGGNPDKGREVFNSMTAKCATCHAYNGQGGKVGPDLTGLKGARPELVFHHVNAPSDRIHPGYPSFTVALKSGQVTMGVVRALEGERIEILDTDARSLQASAFDVAEMRPSSSSVMPSGLAGAIGEQGMRDLIAFLVGGSK
jgi:putative heme-binding domain-containing protein